MTTNLKRTVLALIFTVTLGIAAAACSTENSVDATATDDVDTAQSLETESGDVTDDGGDNGDSTAIQQVDANTASISEMAAAFEANGISNAERWAREVDEYRPYETTDTSFTKLRGELAKYNPSDDVLEAIIASLTL